MSASHSQSTREGEQQGERPPIPRLLRLFCVPVLLGWIAIVAVLNVVVPQLEVVG